MGTQRKLDSTRLVNTFDVMPIKIHRRNLSILKGPVDSVNNSSALS
jgi:hypothetical protein